MPKNSFNRWLANGMNAWGNSDQSWGIPALDKQLRAYEEEELDI